MMLFIGILLVIASYPLEMHEVIWLSAPMFYGGLGLILWTLIRPMYRRF